MPGFTPSKKPFKREMQVTEEEMAEARVPLNLRDFCAHLYIPLMKCRLDNYYIPWKCKKEKHHYEDCQYQDYLDRVRQKRKLDKAQQKAAMEAAMEAKEKLGD